MLSLAIGSWVFRTASEGNMVEAGKWAGKLREKQIKIKCRMPIMILIDPFRIVNHICIRLYRLRYTGGRFQKPPLEVEPALWCVTCTVGLHLSSGGPLSGL